MPETSELSSASLARSFAFCYSSSTENCELRHSYDVGHVTTHAFCGVEVVLLSLSVIAIVVVVIVAVILVVPTVGNSPVLPRTIKASVL